MNAPVTAVSTGSDHDGWREWWATESRRCGSDWAGILAAHATIFQQLCRYREVSS
jgi:hypothetical protein